MDLYKEKPWHSYRDGIVDFLNLRKSGNPAHASFEVDFTRATNIISERRKQGDKSNSTIAYLLWSFAQSVKQHPNMQGIKKNKKIILFDDVDIAMMFEKELPDGEKVPVPYIFRAMQNKSYTDICKELVNVKNKDISEFNRKKKSTLFKGLPGFMRVFILKSIIKDPLKRKTALGTVAYSTLGFSIRNRKFWPVPIGPYPCAIGSGSTYTEGEKIKWCLTISFDHDMNDGAPVVRFGQTFINLMESGEGLNA